MMKVDYRLGDFHSLFTQFIKTARYSNMFIVSDETVWDLYSAKIRESVSVKDDCVFILPPGESAKTLEKSKDLWSAFIARKLDKSSLVIALGGGSVLDITGFAASTYKRGIDVINIPTTLLAQVDASIGGKTAMNFDGLKNMIGTFSFPKLIISDPAFLDTLPPEEIRNGIAEIIKHSLLSGTDYYQLVKEKSNPNEFLNEKIILESAKFKSRIVELDPFDKFERKQLNLGHTFGHALESIMWEKKSAISHGEGVAAGLELELYLAHKYFGLEHMIYEDTSKIVRAFFDRINVEEDDFEKITELMFQDKKSHHNKIMMVVIREPGKAEIDVITPDQVREAIQVYLSL